MPHFVHGQLLGNYHFSAHVISLTNMTNIVIPFQSLSETTFSFMCSSFGTVYHAWDKCRKKDVAIKVLTLNKKQHARYSIDPFPCLLLSVPKNPQSPCSLLRYVLFLRTPNNQVDLENYEKEITFLQEGLFSKYISRLIATYRFEAEVRTEQCT